MNNIAFSLGIISISWYSIFILVGVVLASFIIIKEAKKFNISVDFISNLIFYSLIFGILGARIYYVIFNLDYYLLYPSEIFKIWNGGLAIHGGIIAGLITLIIMCKKENISVFKMADIVVPGVIIAQAIGRWGNFFNSEAHGGIVTLNFLKSIHIPSFIIKGMYINGNYYHPTFLYESVFCVLGFIILLIIRKTKKIKTGNILSIYLVWYGIIRFFIESLRTDSLMLGSIKMAQLVSIIMIITGIIIFLITRIKNPYYKESVVQNGK